MFLSVTIVAICNCTDLNVAIFGWAGNKKKLKVRLKIIAEIYERWNNFNNKLRNDTVFAKE